MPRSGRRGNSGWRSPEETSWNGAVIAVGVPLKKLRGGEIVIGGNEALDELREIRCGNNALVRPLIAGIELGVGIAAAKCDGMFAMSPNGIGRGHDAVLKNSGKCALR